MSRRGNPCDNSHAENFIKKGFKCEEVYLNDYETYQDVVDHLRRVLDQAHYNEKRFQWNGGQLN